jgi:hypothetical protein
VTRSEFEIDVLHKLDNLLGNLGYKRKKHHIYINEIKEEVIGWISLPIERRLKGNLLTISPMIGLRNQAIEKTIANISGWKYDPIIPPTVSINIGYLTPKKWLLNYIFNSEQTARNIQSAIEMINEVKNTGVKFIESNVSLNNLCSTLEDEKFYMPAQSEYRLLCAYYLLGNKTKVIKYSEQELDGRKDNRPPSFFKEFRTLSQELIKRM